MSGLVDVVPIQSVMARGVDGVGAEDQEGLAVDARADGSTDC